MQPFDTRPLAGPQQAVPASQLWQPGPAGSFSLNVPAGLEYDPLTVNSPRPLAVQVARGITGFEPFGLLLVGLAVGALLR